MKTVLGIFVGGASLRMGVPKGAMIVPGTGLTIIEALARRGRDAGMAPVLVGDASPYGALVPEVPRVADDPADIGPLGGLHAVLRHGAGSPVVTVACDMPFVTSAVLTRLMSSEFAAPVLAARRASNAPWEPMLARYDSTDLCETVGQAIAAGVRSFQQLFAQLDIAELTLDDELRRALQDWDTPDDLLGSPE